MITPKLKNIIIICVIGIIVLVIVIIAVKSLINSFKQTPEEKNENRIINSIDKKNVTLKDAEFVTMSDSLDAAFNYVFGTDEEAIYRVLERLSTIDDLFMLMSVFGQRSSDWREIIFAPLAAKGDSGLGSWISSELDEEEIAKVNEILSKKGIDYKF